MPSDSYLDLETVVKEWARAEYDDIANRKQKKLREKERAKRQAYLDLKIDWDDVEFVDKTVKFPLKDDQTGRTKAPDANANATKSPSEPSDTQSGLAGSAKPTMSMLFKTKFRNKTDSVQEYTMKTEKTTTSTFFTETESGYTKGIECSITLKTPCEVLEANAGYHREYSLTSVTGQEFTEELHWGVDSVISVKKGSMAEAELVVFEERKAGNFVVQTDISGRVFVTFTNIRDNNSFVMAVSDDICTIIEAYVKTERRKGKAMDFVTIDSDRGIVHVTTKGTCGFQYGVRQEVLVEQKPLSDDNKGSGDHP